MSSETYRAISDSFFAAGQELRGAAESIGYEYTRPSVVHRPRLFLDGNQWCALFGDNLQEGVAGFGESPAKAMLAFDEAWFADVSE